MTAGNAASQHPPVNGVSQASETDAKRLGCLFADVAYFAADFDRPFSWG